MEIVILILVVAALAVAIGVGLLVRHILYKAADKITNKTSQRHNVGKTNLSDTYNNNVSNK